MSKVSRRRRQGPAQGSPARRMLDDLRQTQAELEVQNQALRYSQLAAEGASERFLTLFSSVPLALMVVDENSLVLESNAMALRVFRPLESDPPLNFLLPLVHEAHADKVAAALVRAREQGSSEATELVLSSGLQGSFTGDLHIARIDNPMDELAHFICAFVDQGPLLAERQALRLSADELRRRNEELQQAQEQRSALEAQLRESHKMQAIGTMAGGIAHDFNNILSAILGNVELARADAPSDSPAQASLAEIDKAGRRARDLVRQILTFSRNELPRRSAIQLADVVRETVRLLKVTLPPQVELQVHMAAEVPLVLADATQVEQALLNLCTNAIQSIGDHRGAVGIELQSVAASAPAPSHLALPAGQRVTLSVRDTGGGIDAATLQRIFEPFFTTKPVGQGTGLGLAVVHGIMRTHEGGVDVQSTPGSGSVFTLHFPVAAPSATLGPTATPARTSQARGTGQHVMYVDDDQALVFLVERVLRRKGFRVTSFTDGQLARDTLKARAGEFDLLVTDYNMPGYSGIDLIRDVRALRPDLPVALASGYVTPDIERAAQEVGARALFHKPNDVAELCDIVQRLVSTDQAADAAATPTAADRA